MGYARAGSHPICVPTGLLQQSDNRRQFLKEIRRKERTDIRSTPLVTADPFHAPHSLIYKHAHIFKDSSGHLRRCGFARSRANILDMCDG